jgi:Dolichyl-phosphate-mannose-protein mannosyltransferase
MNKFKTFIAGNHVFLFFLVWLVIQLVQAGGTELMDDEAYYWVYAQFPAWGYFDHPPMISWVIKAGYGLFHNELGVRLFIVLMSTASLYIIRKLLPHKNDGLFYIIACSIAVVQIGGILAVPDIPLMFFVACFFLAYKSFIQKASFVNTALLGLTMAGMLYCKYHGVLVIFFVFLSNPKMALQTKSWLAILLGAVLFAPHLYWQYQHGFPSVKYHLFERNAPHYKFAFTLEYIGGQLLLLGPFAGWLLIWAALQYKIRDVFTRALRYTIIGVYVFFFISTLKGRVEANWTIPALIPVFILSHQYITRKKGYRLILNYAAVLTLLTVLAVRVYMLLNVQPVSFIKKDELHKNKDWALAIKKQVNNQHVFFENSYQKASKYWFYSGDTSFSLNSVYYRRNNYNIWPVETQFNGKPAYFINTHNDERFIKIAVPLRAAGYIKVDTLVSFSNIDITLSAGSKLNWRKGKNDFNVFIKADKNAYLHIQASSIKNEFLKLYVFNDGDEVVTTIPINIKLLHITPGVHEHTATVENNLPPGNYTGKFSLPSKIGTLNYATLNSSVYKLQVE